MLRPPAASVCVCAKTPAAVTPASPPIRLVVRVKAPETSLPVGARLPRMMEFTMERSAASVPAWRTPPPDAVALVAVLPVMVALTMLTVPPASTAIPPPPSARLPVSVTELPLTVLFVSDSVVAEMPPPRAL